MKLSSVRSLKAELIETPTVAQAVAHAVGTTIRSASMRMRTAHVGTERAATLALGVAPGRSRGDYRLAVRVQVRGPRGQAIADQMARKAAGEADVRIVPTIRKRAPAPSWFRKRRRPLEAGVSVGHIQITAGTLGFVVEDDDFFYALSNNHVLADVNAGSPGDPVVQPGPDDRTPSKATMVGVLDRFVPISFSRSNTVDCAVAQLFEDIEFFVGWTEAVPGRVRGTRKLTVDDLDRPVFKAGRTTGVTEGRITAIDVDRLRVDMGEPGHPRVAIFSDQFEVQGDGRMFSDGGDSGSLIVDGSRRAVGLLFAGGEDDDGNDLTFANHVDSVLAKLGVRLVL
jgi:hypothetical protein